MMPMLKPANSTVELVSELIDSDNWTWHQHVVRDNFIALDAEAILNIPLHFGGGYDFHAWAFDRTGNYTIKTTYRALVTQKELAALEEGTVTGSSQTEEQMWKSLWKLKVLPKVRVFWWRVVRGILPDECTLRHRHIKVISRCNVCNAMDEDLMHALVHCSHAKSFWAAAREVLDLKLSSLHPTTWSRDLVVDTRFSTIERCQIITIMHAIWSSRNRWTHDEDGYNPIQAIKRAREDLALLDLPGDRSSIHEGHAWRPPEPGWV